MNLRLLGARAYVDGGREVQLAAREAALLAHLILSRRPVSREELCRHLWSTVHLTRAKHSLNQLIYSTRRKLARDIIVTSGAVISIVEIESDITDLIRLAEEGEAEKACLTYQGRFLGDGQFDDGTLADWRDAVDAGLARVAAKSLEEWYHQAPTGDYRTIAARAQDLLALHPELEDLRPLLLDTLISSDQIEQALLVYREFRRDPEFALDHRLEKPLLRTPSYGSISQHPGQFIGRKNELDLLLRAWYKSRDGHGGTVLVEGEPGIGKTRLAHHLLRRIAISGGKIWMMACNAATQRIPYSGIADLLRDNAGGLVDPNESLLITANHDGGGATLDERRYRTVQVATEYIEKQSVQQPLALLIDDAQWADEFTALLLTYWSFRLQNHSVLIILTARTEEPMSVPQWIVTDVTVSDRIRLEPLTSSEAKELVAAYSAANEMQVSSRLTDRIVEQSGGRPYLLLESLIESAAEVPHSEGVILPRTAESMLRRRLIGLDSTAWAVACIVSAVRRPITANDLILLSRHDKDTTFNALDELVTRGILTWNNGTIGFPHDLMKETIYRSITPAKMAAFHQAIAQFLLTSGGDCAELAHHFAAGGDAAEAGEHALAAADEALARHLLDDAEHFMRLAMRAGTVEQKSLAAGRLARFLVKLGRTAEVDEPISLLQRSPHDSELLRAIVDFENSVANEIGSSDDLHRKVSRILELALDSPDPDWIPIASTLFDIALDAATRQLGDQVLHTLETWDSTVASPEVRLQMKAFGAAWIGITRGFDNGLKHLEPWFAQLVPSMSGSTHALYYNVRGMLNLLAGMPVRARQDLVESLTYSDKAGDLRRSAAATLNLSIAVMELGEHEAAQNRLVTMMNHPNLHFKVRSHANMALLHLENGNFTLASAVSHRLLSLSNAYGSKSFRRVANAIIGTASIEAGSTAVALSHAEAVAVDMHLDDLVDTNYVTEFVARAKLIEGKSEECLSLIDQGLDRSMERDRLAHMRLLCAKAEMLMLIGRCAPDAHQIVRDVLATASANGAVLIMRRCERLLSAFRMAE